MVVAGARDSSRPNGVSAERVLAGCYWYQFLLTKVVNVRLAVLIINARSGSKFEYTFNDLKAIVGEIVGGALAKLPRYTGSC